MYVAGIFWLSGCVSSNPSAYKPVVVPLASTDVFIAAHQTDQQRFEVRYRHDADGQRMSQVVHSAGTYVGGGREAYDSVRAEARTRMIQNAIETVNGVFITAKTEQMQKVWGSALNKAMYEDLKQETVSKLVGIAQVIGEPRCERLASEPGTTKISCSGQVRVPVVDMVAMEL